MLANKTTYQQNYIHLLTYAYAVSTFASGILVPIYAFYVQKIGGGLLETSWAVAAYSILYGIATILIHKHSWSRSYRMHFLWIGWLLWLFSIAIYLMISTVFILFVSQVLNALGDAMYEPVFDAEYAAQVAADPCVGWAFFNGTISIFSGVAAFLGGFIATQLGFDILLYCVVAVGTFSFFLIARYTYITGKDNPAIN